MPFIRFTRPCTSLWAPMVHFPLVRARVPSFQPYCLFECSAKYMCSVFLKCQYDLTPFQPCAQEIQTIKVSASIFYDWCSNLKICAKMATGDYRASYYYHLWDSGTGFIRCDRFYGVSLCKDFARRTWYNTDGVDLQRTLMGIVKT